MSWSGLLENKRLLLLLSSDAVSGMGKPRHCRQRRGCPWWRARHTQDGPRHCTLLLCLFGQRPFKICNNVTKQRHGPVPVWR